MSHLAHIACLLIEKQRQAGFKESLAYRSHILNNTYIEQFNAEHGLTALASQVLTEWNNLPKENGYSQATKLGNKKYDPKDILNFWYQTKSVKSVMQLSGASDWTVRNILHDNGVIRPYKATFTPREDDLITELWLKGYTGKEISEEIGYSPTTIIARTRKLGLPRRRPGKRHVE